ncbi:MAG: hypothetical protein RQ751_03880 [Longimicrobiales bacterium]|nr:hypothetical protein [Longimicrobiales bacterium]
MLGCWGFERVPERHGPPLADLPDPPAWLHSAFLVQVRDIAHVPRVVAWAKGMRAARPAVPLGLVPGRSEATRRALMDTPFPWTLVVRPETYPGDFPPDGRLEPLLKGSLPRRILLVWERTYGPAGEATPILLELALHATHGRNAQGVASRLRMSRRKLYRQMVAVGYPPPGTLLRQGRVLAYDLRTAQGMDPSDARWAGGWGSADALEKVIRRLGDWRIRVEAL